MKHILNTISNLQNSDESLKEIAKNLSKKHFKGRKNEFLKHLNAFVGNLADVHISTAYKCYKLTLGSINERKQKYLADGTNEELFISMFFKEGMQLTMVPPELETLTFLEELRIFNSPLITPGIFSKLQNLELAEFGGLRLEDMPLEILSLENLKTVYFKRDHREDILLNPLKIIELAMIMGARKTELENLNINEVLYPKKDGDSVSIFLANTLLRLVYYYSILKNNPWKPMAKGQLEKCTNSVREELVLIKQGNINTMRWAYINTTFAMVNLGLLLYIITLLNFSSNE